MTAIRSLAGFGMLAIAGCASAWPSIDVPGLSAVLFLVAGFVIGFPVDRLYAFWLWASESMRGVRHYRTCVVTTPRLQREAREWHFIGYIERER